MEFPTDEDLLAKSHGELLTYINGLHMHLNTMDTSAKQRNIAFEHSLDMRSDLMLESEKLHDRIDTLLELQHLPKLLDKFSECITKSIKTLGDE